VYPVYGKWPGNRNSAYGVVIAADGSLYALVHVNEEWNEIDVVECESGTVGGISVDEHEKLENLQSEIGREIGV